MCILDVVRVFVDITLVQLFIKSPQFVLDGKFGYIQARITENYPSELFQNRYLS